MQFTHINHGVCSQSVDISVENNMIQNVRFHGGCNGNLQGIAALVQGMDVDDVIEKLSGIRCGFKNTSCPAQLAEALKEYKLKR